jgi:hypothetical protein
MKLPRDPLYERDVVLIGRDDMDPVNLTYYAVVCGGLAAYAPSVRNVAIRTVVGLSLGGFSAMMLPVVHFFLGF